MGCGLGHHQHVEPQRRALLRDRIADLDTIAGLLGTGCSLHDVAIEADHRADNAIGQVTDVLGRMKVLHIRMDLQQRLLGLPVVARGMAVMQQPR